MRKICLLLMACAATAFASTDSRSVLLNDSTRMEVTALSPSIFKVTTLGAKAQMPSEQSVLTLAPSDAGIEVNRDASGAYTFSSPGKGTVTLAPGRGLSVLTSQGVTLADKGTASKGRVTIESDGTGSFYGAGERGHSFNLRGDTLVNYNRPTYGYGDGDSRINQMNITMPVILGTDGYALVFDDFAASTLVAGPSIDYVSEAASPISYYIILEPDLAGQTEAMTALTGRQPLPPLWTLGYVTSKYGYRTQAETEGVVDTLLSRGYPLDGLVLDLYWFGREEDMGNLDWDRQAFPNPEQMLAGLAAKNVNVITISEPFILTNGKGITNFGELDGRRMFIRDSIGNTHPVTIWVGEGSMMDVSNPETRQWLKDKYRQYLGQGVAALWGDLGEPEMHPNTAVHANGLPARLYHNRYGNDWASIISEIYDNEFDTDRHMILMRAGTTGLQRHGVFPWSGDVARSWEGLRAQPKIMLNSGLSGLGYMSHDVGGFAVDDEHARQPELYVRWLQTGLFTPMLRTHAQKFAEPYNYPEYEDILRDLIRARYTWLPYNYTLAYENHMAGRPFVRPLDFNSNAKGAYDNITDQYLWGNDVMVAPVMTPGATSRAIVFPAGSKWYDYSDASVVFEGGSSVADYPAPVEKLPLFVREGAFIPSADYAMNSTADFRADELTVTYYPSAEPSEAVVFNDLRDPLPAEVSLLEMKASPADRTITLTQLGNQFGPDGLVKVHLMWAVNPPTTVRLEGTDTPIPFGSRGAWLTLTPGKPLTLHFNEF